MDEIERTRLSPLEQDLIQQLKTLPRIDDEEDYDDEPAVDTAFDVDSFTAYSAARFD